MKLTKITKVLLLSAVVLSVFTFISCDLFGDLFGVTFPAELRGKWSRTTTFGYYESFTFTATEVSYFGQSTEYAGYDASWSGEIEELYEDERIIRLDDDMYLRYEITGSTLYLEKTNPYADKPEADYDWGGGYTLTKE